jgi:cytochrome c2
MSDEPTGNAANGKKVFARNCQTCHNAAPKGKHAVGPALYGVYGRAIASGAGFKYSGSLTSKKGQNWTAATLDKWLENPGGFASGTSMAFAGLKSKEERDDVIRYLYEARPKSKK